MEFDIEEFRDAVEINRYSVDRTKAAGFLQRQLGKGALETIHRWEIRLKQGQLGWQFFSKRDRRLGLWLTMPPEQHVFVCLETERAKVEAGVFSDSIGQMRGQRKVGGQESTVEVDRRGGKATPFCERSFLW